MLEILYLLIPLQVMVLSLVYKQAGQIGKLCGYITQKENVNETERHDFQDNNKKKGGELTLIQSNQITLYSYCTVFD